MSLKEVELAIKALTITLQAFQGQEDLTQESTSIADVAGTKLILQDQDLLEDDIEIIDVDVATSSLIVKKELPSPQPRVKSVKLETGVTSGKTKSFKSGQARALQKRLHKIETRLTSIENGILVNLCTIQEHLKNIKDIQQELSKCRALFDNQL